MEKHLYEILPASVTSSPPCYYCGETDLVRTSVESDLTYPLCHYCKTVKKFGPVSKRKKRAILAPKQKKKNKRKTNVGDTFVEFLDDDPEDLTMKSDEEGDETMALKELNTADSGDDIEDSFEDITSEATNVSADDMGSLPPSPSSYTPVEELLDNSD